MFPLGLALLPGAVLPLHIFEPRYRRMVADLLSADDDMRFGVVLIERGRESGGGETRSDGGTVARVLDVRVLEDGRFTMLTVGSDRFVVDTWLPDDPYPEAMVTALDDDETGPPSDAPELIERAVDLARRAGHSVEAPERIDVCPTFAAAAMGAIAAAAIAPIAEVDRQRLLRLTSESKRRTAVEEALDDLEAILRFSGD